MKLPWKKLIFFAILIIAAYFIYTAVTASTRPKKITTAQASYKDIKTTVSASGKIQAVNQRSLSFNSIGKLLYMPFREGDDVKKGQLIGYLDQSDLSAQTNKSWSDYRNSLEKLREFENNNKDKPKTDSYTISKSQLEASRDSFAALVASSLAVQNKATLVSPISGTITIINSKQGESVTAGSPVMIIADLGELEFVAETDEQDIGNVVASQPAILNIDAFPKAEIKGQVKEISKSSKTNASGGTYFPTKISLDSNDYTLRSGMNGDVEITTLQKKNVLAIGRDLVQEDDKNEYVFVVSSGKIQKKIIKTGIKNDFDVEITDGLTTEDHLVTGDLSKIKEGDKVTE